MQKHPQNTSKINLVHIQKIINNDKKDISGMKGLFSNHMSASIISHEHRIKKVIHTVISLRTLDRI